MNTAEMNQKELRAACKDLEISGYAKLTVAAMRDAIELYSAGKQPTKSVAVHTAPVAKTIAPRTALVAKGGRINQHHNDDGSITLYSAGLKVFRTLATEGDGDDVAEEGYDPDAVVAQFCAKWFGTSAHKYGKTTYGHNWKSRKVAASTSAPTGPPA